MAGGRLAMAPDSPYICAMAKNDPPLLIVTTHVSQAPNDKRSGWFQWSD